MKRLLALVAMCLTLAWCQQALADDPPIGNLTDVEISADQPAVLQDPAGSWQKVKTAIDVFKPSYAQFYDIESGEWYNVVAGSLVNLRSHGIHLASLQGAYGIDYKAAIGVQFNLPGITKRYLEPYLPDVLKTGLLQSFWRAVGKYGYAGFCVGRDFDREEMVWGPMVGGTFRINF